MVAVLMTWVDEIVEAFHDAVDARFERLDEAEARLKAELEHAPGKSDVRHTV